MSGRRVTPKSDKERILRLGRLLKEKLEPVAKQVQKTLTKVAQKAPEDAKLFFDMETFWPEPYALDTSHLAVHPEHYVLNYLKKTDAEANRLRDRLARKEGNRRPDDRPGSQYDMHEFPFNATVQASEDDSSVAYVVNSQNRLQGAYYGWFVDKRLDYVDGAAFIVVPIPDIVPD